MIDHLIKKLGIFSNKRIQVRGAKDTYKYIVNEAEKARFDTLMRRMNPPVQNMSDEVCLKLLNEEQQDEEQQEEEEQCEDKTPDDENNVNKDVKETKKRFYIRH
eukprot:scaffold314_cov265-Ochromonas_danica.AAC.1